MNICKNQLKKTMYNGVIGMAIGDALGVPVEFRERDTYTISNMTTGTHGQKPGTWSDDTSMTLATLDSIREKKCVNYEDIMNKFCNWLHNGKYTVRGDVFDVGVTTINAINNYISGKPVMDCGEKAIYSNGNGGLMRILPVSILEPQNAVFVGMLTHAHPISQIMYKMYTCFIQYLLTGMNKHVAYNMMLTKYKTNETISKEDISPFYSLYSLKRDEIKSTGYVIDTLVAAFWCFILTDTYKDCVLTAVNLGGDTDTIAAIAGGIAGIYYGCTWNRPSYIRDVNNKKDILNKSSYIEAIPEEWIKQVAKYKYIKKLCYQAVSSHDFKIERIKDE